ncbi:triphosphoribosyl-dephospho-CoA synthase [Caballeronia sp. LjRoot34]|uniref:triphosphoribosyl-dephospho-CoA synthase n=1 Tax=Caballeronia sp. LjRoot34 TaxID=3342325 RepID=UPI003ECFADCD
MDFATQYPRCFVSETEGLALSDPARASCLSPDAMSPPQTGSNASDYLARTAVRALIDEAELTPKPALVDRMGNGAHADLDLKLMVRSAQSLHPGFAAMAMAAAAESPAQALRETLGRIGRESENAMLAVTHGSNTHRGAIWVLGLLVAAAARERTRNPVDVAAFAASISRHRDRFATLSLSNGLRVKRRYGVRGARGEAADGFPHVVSLALPMLRQSRSRGNGEDAARLDALLAIMSSLDDTCLLHRGGYEALSIAKRGATEALAAGGAGTATGREHLDRLDCALLARNASPGGAADLLAATLFLDRIERDDPSSISPS